MKTEQIGTRLTFIAQDNANINWPDRVDRFVEQHRMQLIYDFALSKQTIANSVIRFPPATEYPIEEVTCYFSSSEQLKDFLTEMRLSALECDY